MPAAASERASTGSLLTQANKLSRTYAVLLEKPGAEAAIEGTANEWNTRSVRDAFFASPQFPRLLNSDSIKDTIARGVENGRLGYVGKKPDGSYAPFHWNSSLPSQDVEISDDVFLIQRELAEAYEAGIPPKDVIEPKSPFQNFIRGYKAFLA
jgi:hypothetical protein